jgi:hypothetical protein
MKNAKKRKRGKPFTAKNQPSNESKRKPKSKTIVKGKVGLETWDSLQEFLLTKGAKKFISTMMKLEGKSYAQAYLAAVEYFKPKLSRSELSAPNGKPLIPENDLTKLSDKELRVLIALQSKSRTGAEKSA